MFGGLSGLAATVADAQKLCQDAGGWWDITGHVGCMIGKTKVAIKAIGALTSGGFTAVFIGPLLYMVGSLISSVMYLMVFSLWFAFYGVHIWSFTKAKKLFINLITLVVESIPGPDMLPTITIMVFTHIKVSRAEDRVAHIEAQAKMRRGPRQRMYQNKRLQSGVADDYRRVAKAA